MTALVHTLSHSILDNAVSRFLAGAGRVVASIAAAQAATEEFKRLNARTDAQLAAEGLHRSRIGATVFERHYR